LIGGTRMKIADLKIGHRLNISFALTIAALAVVVALGASRLAMVSGEIDLTVNDRYDKISLLNDIQTNLNVQARDLRNALLLPEAARAQAELAKVDQADAGLKRDFELLDSRIRVPAARELLRTIGQARDTFAPVRERLSALIRAGQKDAAATLLFAELAPAQAAYLAAIDKLIAFQVELMHSSGNGARDLAHSAGNAMIVLGVAGAVLSMLTAWFITRGIVGPLDDAVRIARTVASGDLGSRIEVRSRDEIGQLAQALKDMNESLVTIVGKVRGGTDTIARASAEIAAGNQDLSMRTEEQASSLEETASSMEQMTSAVRQNADHARTANQLALSASEVAGKGGAVVAEVVQTMEAINLASRKIVDIIGVIDGIAFQTNILALNAAVEAARAGEQGRGFAVVAGEVRNLAQRSAAAAKEIKGLIGASVSEVDAGARLVGAAGRTMDEIVGSVRRVTDIMSEISAANAEQLVGIEQVNEAIVQMDQVTQQNAALVEEAAAAAAAMQDQAAGLSAAVGVFKLDAAQTASGSAHLAAVIPMRRTAASAARGLHQLERPKQIVASGSGGARIAAESAPADWEEF